MWWYSIRTTVASVATALDRFLWLASVDLSLKHVSIMAESPAVETAPFQVDASTSLPQPTYRPDDELPTNVQEKEQLALLPPECLSGDKERPLRHVDDQGNVYHYSLKPMTYAAVLILSVELLERFSFYGTTNDASAF